MSSKLKYVLQNCNSKLSTYVFDYLQALLDQSNWFPRIVLIRFFPATSVSN
jgi:hypothetical protein